MTGKGDNDSKEAETVGGYLIHPVGTVSKTKSSLRVRVGDQFNKACTTTKERQDCPGNGVHEKAGAAAHIRTRTEHYKVVQRYRQDMFPGCDENEIIAVVWPRNVA